MTAQTAHCALPWNPFTTKGKNHPLKLILKKNFNKKVPAVPGPSPPTAISTETDHEFGIW